MLRLYLELKECLEITCFDQKIFAFSFPPTGVSQNEFDFTPFFHVFKQWVWSFFFFFFWSFFPHQNGGFHFFQYLAGLRQFQEFESGPSALSGGWKKLFWKRKNASCLMFTSTWTVQRSRARFLLENSEKIKSIRLL